MGRSRIQLYQTNNGPCPYRDTGIWRNLSFHTEAVSAHAYRTLMDQGFRRSGASIYHPACPGCQRCIPLRIDVQNFQPSKSQRRTARKNQDLEIDMVPLQFEQEHFQLYQRYQELWHHSQVEPEDYYEFLIRSPVETEIMTYRLQGELIGLGWVDKAEDALSSVYFAFNPDHADRRLGVYSVLAEVDYCRVLNLSWLYMGYWVEDSEKMRYKADYRPAEILVDQEWISLDSYLSEADQ